jgi:hypothetical protein
LADISYFSLGLVFWAETLSGFAGGRVYSSEEVTKVVWNKRETSHFRGESTMRRALLNLSLGLAVLVGAATASFAHGGHGGGGHGGSHGGGGHWHGGGSHGGGHGHVGKWHGHKFRHRHYRTWNRYCWFPQYRCYGYYCPDDGVWYYWYGPDNCYLPVSDMATYPPDDSVNAPPSLPPGATSVP